MTRPRIEHLGLLVGECTLPGETRADNIFCAQPNGIPLGADRWLLIYATRSYRLVDDENSIVYQIREGAPDGRVLREGFFARAHEGWDVLGDGRLLVKEHCHCSAFGVPRGAMIQGKPVPHANRFVASWYALGKQWNGDRLEHTDELLRRTLRAEWAQFKLNERGDDIEFLMPAQPMRQVGYESGPHFCSLPAIWTNNSFKNATPCNEEATEWVQVQGMGQEGDRCDGPGATAFLAPVRFRFNPSRDLYEWVETGPPVGWPGPIGEPSLLRYRDSWIFTGRTKGPILWYRTDDLFGAHPPCAAIEMTHPNSHSPHTAHLCPDGVVRLLVGDHTVSPHRNARDPLYLWDVDPDHGFRLTRRQTVFDSVAAGLSIRKEAIPRVDYGNLLPHTGGRVQHLVHRVRTKVVDLPDKTGTVVNLSEKAVHGIYHARLVYDHEFPGIWQFGSPAQDPGTCNTTVKKANR